MKKTSIDYYLFFVIVGIGLILRLYLILTKNIFHDELAYINIARVTSVKDILLINHWIKDHGIVYYLFLKPFIFLTHNIIYLRLTNVFLYILSSFVIFIVFKKRSHVLLGLLTVFLYSFHRYFIYLNAQVSPFNLVLFFSILSMWFLYDSVSEQEIKLIFRPSLVLFIVSTILGFYSDYSFFYMGFFYLFVLIWAVVTRHRIFLLLTSYLFVLVFIIPGIFQFISNFSNTTLLFENSYQNQSFSFVNLIKELTKTMVLRTNPTVSLIFLVCLFYLVLLIKKLKNNATLLLIARVLIITFLMNTVLLYLFSQHFFTLLIERSFWFFNMSLIMLVSITIYTFCKQNRFISYTVFIVFTLFGLVNFAYSSNTISDVALELKYDTLLEGLTNEKKPIYTVFVVDRKHAFTVLSDYYFSKIYPRSDKYYAPINTIRNNLVTIERYQSLQNIKIKESTLDYVLIVLFSPSSNELEMAKMLKNQNLKTIIYYSKQINSYQSDFFVL